MKLNLIPVILGFLVLMVSGCLQSPKAEPEVQVINMTVDASGWNPDIFVLKKGAAVQWNINVKELTNCNKEILVKDYGLDIKLKNGTNIVEFTPNNTGAIRWACWMDMIPGTFIVVNDPKNADEVANMTASIVPVKMSNMKK